MTLAIKPNRKNDYLLHKLSNKILPTLFVLPAKTKKRKQIKIFILKLVYCASSLLNQVLNTDFSTLSTTFAPALTSFVVLLIISLRRDFICLRNLETEKMYGGTKPHLIKCFIRIYLLPLNHCLFNCTKDLFT